MLEPLLQLRGEWRQAAAVSVPASAGEITQLLDRAIDVLDANYQLDEESLLMAAELVCTSVTARPDVVAMLRVRLVRAAHDFVMVTAVESAGERNSGGGSAFESEEALAAALFAGIGIPEVEVEPNPNVRDPARPRIDSRALQQSLSNRVAWSRNRWFRLIRSAVLLVVIGLVLLYVYTNPPTY